MRVPILMPQLGESIAEATIVQLRVQPGDQVEVDQEIIEVETNKALLNVTAPATGRLEEWLAQVQETYPVGAVLGHLEVEAEVARRLGLSPEPAPAARPLDAADEASALPAAAEIPGREGNGTEHAEEDHPAAPARFDPAVVFGSEGTGEAGPAPRELVPGPALRPAAPAGRLPGGAGEAAGYLSPRVRARLAELGWEAADLAALAGQGTGGRTTAQDLERLVARWDAQPAENASALRVAVADAMRRSWARPLATAGRSVDLDPVLAHRRTFARDVPGLTLYVLRALALALAADSTPAARLVGRRIVRPASLDLAFAVEVSDGVITPVLRGVDRLPLRELVAPYQELLAAARQRRLGAAATGEALATVTNYGPFGLNWATPIPLPDQTLIIGLGAGRKAPRWDEERGQFVPATQAELTASFDHRSLDGGGAGRLLERLAGLLAAPDQL